MGMDALLHIRSQRVVASIRRGICVVLLRVVLGKGNQELHIILPKGGSGLDKKKKRKDALWRGGRGGGGAVDMRVVRACNDASA